MEPIWVSEDNSDSKKAELCRKNHEMAPIIVQFALLFFVLTTAESIWTPKCDAKNYS